MPLFIGTRGVTNDVKHLANDQMRLPIDRLKSMYPTLIDHADDRSLICTIIWAIGKTIIDQSIVSHEMGIDRKNHRSEYHVMRISVPE